MKVKDLLKQVGLNKTEELGSWKGYTVLAATSDVIRYLGLPQYILLHADSDNARWASPEETIELMNIFCI